MSRRHLDHPLLLLVDFSSGTSWSSVSKRSSPHSWSRYLWPPEVNVGKFIICSMVSCQKTISMDRSTCWEDMSSEMVKNVGLRRRQGSSRTIKRRRFFLEQWVSFVMNTFDFEHSTWSALTTGCLAWWPINVAWSSSIASCRSCSSCTWRC